MTETAAARPRPVRRGRMALVLAVLVGVLAMHGLAAGSALSGGAEAHGAAAHGNSAAPREASDAAHGNSAAPQEASDAAHGNGAAPHNASDAPTGYPAVPHDAPKAAHSTPAPPHDEAAEHMDCPPPCGGEGEDGHPAAHADSTCAAGGTGTSYAVPVLCGSGVTVPRADVRAGRVASAGVVGRAPPDLAELQLLRM